MPRSGMAAASTALPQPPRTSQNVPMNSAASLRDISMVESPLDEIAPSNASGGIIHLQSIRRQSAFGLAACPGEIIVIARFDGQGEEARHGVRVERPGCLDHVIDQRLARLDEGGDLRPGLQLADRKSTRLNS